MNRIAHPMISLLVGLMAIVPLYAQDTAEGDLRAGRSFMETTVYTLEEDLAILEIYEGLRVADVSDGMDQAGLRGTGLVSTEIGPLWRDTKNFTHRIVGVAVTARYVPTNRPIPGPMATEQFDQWVGNFYNQHSAEPFVDLIRQGTVVVIEDAMQSDVGSIGSNNIMAWKVKGSRGVVTNATARDTDEIAAQGNPLYYAQPGRGIRPGRNEIESVNRPIVVGGVLVMPGDIIVADGDGVIVVPRQHALAVASYADATLDKDKGERRVLYEKLGMPIDDSVK